MQLVINKPQNQLYQLFKMDKDTFTELQIDIEDLPSKPKDELKSLLTVTKGKSKKDIAFEFISRLETAFKDGDLKTMTYLYDFVFNKLSYECFKGKPWPKVKNLPNNDKINRIVRLLYKELTYRHLFARLSNTIDIQTRLDSYQNYLELLANDFKPVGLNKNQLPGCWIWDILDEFIYQYITFCFYKTKLSGKGDVKDRNLINADNLPNIGQVEDTLDRFIYDTGDIVDEEEGYFFEETPALNTTALFGYYAYAVKIKLFMSTGIFDKATFLVKNLDLTKGKIFAKSWSCVINLFYYSSICFLKNHKFVFCGRFSEYIISFYLKYSHFFSK